MKFTDLFVRRPVLATVVSLLIVVIGLRALSSLPVLRYPRTENAVVTVSTTYYGADADVVAGFITTPLENAIAQANGIDFLSSKSQNGQSTITANLRLNYDSNKALTEISTKVNAVKNQLPPQSQQPVITVEIGETIAAMYIGFNSDVLPQNNITDYLLRVVQPRLQAVEGIQTADILGAQNFALRAWLDPQKLAAYNLTASDVSTAISKNNYVSGLGNTKGQMVQVNLTASTDLRTLEEFRNLIVKENNGSFVRLSDVANVSLGSEDYESRVAFDGKQAVYVALKLAPTANLLATMKRVRAIYPDIIAQLPQGIHTDIVYDSTDFVQSSIDEVESTLIEATLIVAVVVFLFLGSIRSVLIPIIAIPLSLIGAFIFMQAMGFSVNLLTLLALVLAIGLVVDDAIIVVENVNRHLEEGMTPTDASLQAARELANPIIAMTVVLIAAYVPIGMQGGLTGALFIEFAFTLVAAIIVSAIVALTLSPMLCSKLFHAHVDKPTGWEDKFTAKVDELFERLKHGYETKLRSSLDYVPVTLVFVGIVLASLYFLFSTAKSELAPQEDQGVVIAMQSASPTATLEQRKLYSDKVYQILSSYPETGHVFQIDSPSMTIAGSRLKPWDERERTADQLQPDMQTKIDGVAGLRAALFQPPPLPGSRGLPVQFVIGSTQGFPLLADVSDKFMLEAIKTGKFMFLDNDLKVDLPQAKVVIDRDKVAQMGLNMSDVGGALSSMLGGGYVNYFNFSGRAYKVIPQVEQKSRLNASDLDNYYIRTSSGETVALSTVARVETTAIPRALSRFQQMNAATISGVAMPGVPLGEALQTLKDLAKTNLPQGYTVDYAGVSRQFGQESSGFFFTLGFAVLIIFLTLAAQYESFRDPLIILFSVPASLAGALIFITLGVGGSTVNIYTQVGLVTLTGLISKHGILMTEFANNLQAAGRSKHDAIIEASAIRLRPILMTTAAMVLGVVPLLLSTGAGAESRFNLGLVIATGLAIGTFFTLFVVPAVYMVMAADHHKKKEEESSLAEIAE